MIDLLSTPLLTLSDKLVFNTALGIILLASLVFAILARQKGRHPLLWYLAGAAGSTLAYALILWILPAAGDEGQPLSKWQNLWRDPEFRADALLLLSGIFGGVWLIRAISRLRFQALDLSDGENDSPKIRAATTTLSLISLGLPLLIWLVMSLFLIAENGERFATLLIFIGAATLAGGMAYALDDLARTLSLSGLALLLMIAQAYYNSTLEQPESLLAPRINIPLFLPLIPYGLGWFVAGIFKKHRHTLRYPALMWDLSGTAWGLAVLGFFTRFFGEYEFGGSFASDLATVAEAPFQILIRLTGHTYYQILPGDIPDERNLAALTDLNFLLAVIAALLVWGAVGWRLYRSESRVGVSRDAIYRVREKLEKWRHLSLNQQRYLAAIVLITPAIVLRAFTTLYPFLETFALSFQRHNPAFPPRSYGGLRNFERLANDLVVRESLEFTLIFVFGSTFFQVVLGLAIAHLLNAEFRLRGFSRMISLIPWAIPMVVVGIAARWLFDDDFGMIPDLARRLLGIETNWLIDPVIAKYAVLSVSIWKSTPFVALILLAGLQGVPQDLYEAARVDGANRLQQLRYVTVPMLLPIIVTISMFMLVWQLATFDLPFTMTGGGPGFSTTVLAQKIYLEINSLNYSYAAALGIVLVGLVAIIGGLGMSLFRRVEVSQ